MTSVFRSPRRINYTPAVLSFLVISLFGWYALRPTLQTIIFLRREIADFSKVNQQMEQKIEALIQAQSVYGAVEEQLPLLTEALPDDPEALPAIYRIREIVADSQATLSSSLVGSSPIIGTDKRQEISQHSEPIIKQLPITLTIQGNYFALETCLNNLLSQKRILTIELLTLYPSKGVRTDADSFTLELVVRGTVYYLSDS